MAAIYSGLVFGIYWIPLRALEQVGFSGIWATFTFNLVSSIVVLPIVIIGWRSFVFGRLKFHLICFGIGLGFTLYASAFVYTNVVSVIVMFYMMPIWGFLLARWLIGEVITPVRWLSMLFGVGGLITILGIDAGVPLPQNVGDWMALVAGIVWAYLSLTLLTDQHVQKPSHYAAGFIIWGAITSFVMGLVATSYGFEPNPSWSNLSTELVWLVPFAIIVIVPAAIATIFGPIKLNPGIVGLLFMTEISVAVVTAALWANEPFGWQQIIGVLLITIAGVLETAYQAIIERRQRIGKR